MLATFVAVALLEALLVAELASGSQLLLCIYPSQQVQGITCSTDGSSLISIESIQATRLGKDTSTCAQDRIRNVPVMSQCTYTLNTGTFYYQYQYPRCNLQRSCLVNGDFPSAIVILGPGNCTADSTGYERNAVIITWSCVAAAFWDSSHNDTGVTESSNPLASTRSAGGSDGDALSSAVVGAIVGSAIFVVVAVITAAGLLVLARQGRLRSWTALAVKLHCCLPGSVAGESRGHSNCQPQHPVALQPTVLVIDKHGNLSSALQESLSRNERDSVKKPPAQRKTSKKEAGGSVASDLEVEVDTSDDYQKLSGDLSDVCDEGAAQRADAAENEIPDHFDDGCLPPKADCERAVSASTVHEKPTAARQLSPSNVAPPGLSDGGSGGRTANLDGSGGDVAGGDVVDNAESRKPAERGDKKLSRRRQYEIKWNARYGDVTETETDDRRPPPVPPPYVLDPDPNTYQLPWLPSPPDSSDEC